MVREPSVINLDINKPLLKLRGDQKEILPGGTLAGMGGHHPAPGVPQILNLNKAMPSPKWHQGQGMGLKVEITRKKAWATPIGQNSLSGSMEQLFSSRGLHRKAINDCTKEPLSANKEVGKMDARGSNQLSSNRVRRSSGRDGR